MIDSAQGSASLSTAAEETPTGPFASVAGTLPAQNPSRRWWQRAGTASDHDVDLLDDRVAANAWIPVALVALIAGAFLFRFAAAQHLSSHVDEAASVLAAEMVAEKGVPVFPSGTLYLQGATISYILAPLLRLGYGGLDDLLPLRLLSVLAGTLAVFVAFRLGRLVTGSAAAGFVVALLIAIDPVSVRWSGMVRMYALLQCVSLILLWFFLRALLRPPNRRDLAIMTAVFWFGVYTHIAICLFLPGMAIAALLTYGRDLQDRRRDLAVALVACAAAPAIMMGLSSFVTPPDESVSTSLPGISFVGDFLFSFDQILNPTFRSWTLLFSYSSTGAIVPALILGVSCVLAGRHFLGEPGRTRFTVERRRMISALFLLFWLPIFVVAAIATEQNERYLLHIHPIGLLLLVLLAYDLIAHPIPSLQAAALTRTRAAASSSLDVAQPPRRPRSAAPRLATERAAVLPQGAARSLPSWLSARVLAVAGFATVVVLGAVIRISNLNNLSLWLDEGFTILYSRQEWSAVAGMQGFYSPHPPLFFTLVKVSDLFFPAEIAGRLISVAAGIATIPVFYLLIAKVLDRRAAFVASLVLVLSPIHLYYSQEARMYALVVFLIAFSYLALVSYNQRPHLGWAAVYGVTAALALWVDYSSVYALAPQALLILVQFYRHRRAGAPLLVAGILAVVAYAPWIPQVLSSVDAANLVERRESYLGVDSSRVFTTLLAMMGYAGDGSYFQSLRQTAWNRWPDSRAILVIAALPVIVVGFKGLWRRWEAMVVVGGLLGTMLVGIWVSLISPGFAERTVLATVLGWAALLGAAVSAQASRLVKGVAVMSLAAVLLIQASTIGVIYDGAIKQQWRAATADVALISPLNFPVVTYSYGAVADTLLDVYEPGLIDTARVITIRDGALENVLSGGVIPEVGLTRTRDLPAGRLAEVLPDTPDNDLIWYLYYHREGESDVRAAIRRIGYTRIQLNHYVAPRYQVYLELYARPGANLGTAIPIDPTFAAQEGGWVLPPDGAAVSTGDTQAEELTITNQTLIGQEAFMLVDSPGLVLATMSAEVLTSLPNANVQVVVSCLSTAGTELATQIAAVPRQVGSATVWRSVRVSALCPAETTLVRLTLRNTGFGDVTYRNPSMHVMPIPRQP